jgi:hypothetical protein
LNHHEATRFAHRLIGEWLRHEIDGLKIDRVGQPDSWAAGADADKIIGVLAHWAELHARRGPITTDRAPRVPQYKGERLPLDGPEDALPPDGAFPEDCTWTPAVGSLADAVDDIALAREIVTAAGNPPPFENVIAAPTTLVEQTDDGYRFRLITGRVVRVKETPQAFVFFDEQPVIEHGGGITTEERDEILHACQSVFAGSWHDAPDTRRLQNDTPDVVCEHGVAMDVHCCHCHSGFIFDKNHVCPPAPLREDTQVGALVEAVGAEITEPLRLHLGDDLAAALPSTTPCGDTCVTPSGEVFRCARDAQHGELPHEWTIVEYPDGRCSHRSLKADGWWSCVADRNHDGNHTLAKEIA